MVKKTVAIVILVLIIIGIVAYGHSRNEDSIRATIDSTEEARNLVIDFGEEMKNVSLLAPSDILAASMDAHYGKYLAPELLSSWKHDPSTALGREVSNPYPDRIEIGSVTVDDGNEYTVVGRVIEITSDQAGTGNVTDTYEVTFTLKDRNGTLLIYSADKANISDIGSS